MRSDLMFVPADYEIVLESSFPETITRSTDFELAVALFRAAIPRYRHRVIELRQGSAVLRTYIPPQ